METIDGEDTVKSLKLRNVVTGEKSNLEVGGVFVAIGFKPNTAYLKGLLPLDEAGYIITNEKMETAISGILAAGDIRANGWSLNRTSTTISILIEGSLVALFRGPGWRQEVTLKRKGDYVIFREGVEHSWYSEVESLVLTIRTPSVKDDQEHFSD